MRNLIGYVWTSPSRSNHALDCEISLGNETITGIGLEGDVALPSTPADCSQSKPEISLACHSPSGFQYLAQVPGSDSSLSFRADHKIYVELNIM